MAWTAPASWSVAEIVTAAKMNTHVRDNLNYLKGNAGTVDIADLVQITRSGTPMITMINSGAAIKGYMGVRSSNHMDIDVNRNPGTGTFDDTGKSHAAILLDGSGAASFLSLYTANAANTAATERLRITGAGAMGLNQTAPGGLFEVRPVGSTPGGFLTYAVTGIGASTITLIPDGTGDAASGCLFCAYTKRAGSTSQSTGFANVATPGAGNTDTNAFDDGGTNRLVIRLASTGALTLVRTLGTGTYDISIMVVWL